MTNPAGSRVRWLKKSLLILGRGLGVLFLALGLLIIIREQIPWVMSEAGEGERVWRGLLTAVTLVAFLASLWLWLFRIQRIAWAIACMLLAVICGDRWMLWDDPKIDYPPEDYFTEPDFSEAKATHDLVLRYRSGVDSTLPTDLPLLKEPASTKDGEASSNEKWNEFLTENRAEIERGWEQLADRRSWVAEMSRAPRLGDLTMGLGDPLPAFQDMRAAARFMTWHARALALEGRGDEALAEIGLLLDVSQKLLPESRTLVRGMIARVIHKMALHSAGYVLDVTVTSTASRHRLLAVLQGRPDAADTAYQMLWCEYPLGAKMMMDSIPNEYASTFYNPRNTVNLHADIIGKLATSASRRELDAMNTISEAWVSPSFYWRSKNMVGRLLIAMTLPAFRKVVKVHWEIEDLAVALELRLQSEQ